MKRLSRAQQWVLGLVLAGLALIVLVSTTSASKPQALASTTPTTASPAAPTSHLNTSTSPTSAAKIVADAPVPEPAPTISQANALEKAADYLDYSAFSRTGLIEQLEFEGFSTADAKYAVDHVTVDWMVQAERKARNYLDYSAFSHSGLLEQMKFEGFTTAEAEHGVKSVGL